LGSAGEYVKPYTPPGSEFTPVPSSAADTMRTPCVTRSAS